MSKEIKKRNGEIDLLRFIFSIVIVFHHFNISYKFDLFSRGYIGVEFFFLLSGFLMAKQMERLQPTEQLHPKEIADMTWKFILKKISVFYSYYVCVIVLQLVVRNIIIRDESFIKILDRLLRGIPTLSLTFMGLNNTSPSLYAGSTWYLSAMIIAMFLLYPLLVKSYDYTVRIIFPIITVSVLGYLYATNNTIAVWQGWTGFCYGGVLRAVAELAFGASLCPLLSWFTQKYSWLINSEKFPIKTLLTLLKYGAYLIVLVFAFGHFSGDNFNLHALLFCAIGILLSFSNAGYCIPDSRITRHLGKLSLPIYIFHGVIRYIILDITDSAPISLGKFFFTIVFSIFTSVVLMYITDYIKLLIDFISKKIRIYSEANKT